jgi:hypothetical protein
VKDQGNARCKKIIAESDELPTLILDEIDTGFLEKLLKKSET